MLLTSYLFTHQVVALNSLYHHQWVCSEVWTADASDTNPHSASIFNL